MYADAVDDAKLRLLAFEDRWHFVAVLCLKAEGMLDDDTATRDRLIAVKLGLTVREADEVKRRLCEIGLIDENWQPVAWEKRQYISDTSTDRVQKHRKTKEIRAKRETAKKRFSNVSETPPETDTESDTETEADTEKGRGAIALATDLDHAVTEWNDLAGKIGLPAVQRLTPARKSQLKNRLAECGGLEGWRTALDKLAASSFCRGDSRSGWRADFDFILQAKSFTKLMEGSYDDRTGEGRKSGTASAVAGILGAAD